ncbi:MAG: DNA polymerase [Dehalococcoidia bacterium]|nr:DNA polymerase [Dehalococcoidia bacterium]
MTVVVPNYIPDDRPVKVAFVGEAPAAHEVAKRHPFVGPAGWELDTWLQGIFIRSRCFIGNLSQVRAPGDRIENMLIGKEPGAELAKWIEVLRSQLEELRPNLVIALGNVPMWFLAGKEGITKWWGSLLPCTLVPGLKVMPLPHPSFVLRGKRILRPIIRTWLRRAREEAETPELKVPERELVVNPSFEQVISELERLQWSDVICGDIETSHSKRITRTGPRGLVFNPPVITCIALSDSPNWSICIPFFRNGQPRWEINREMEIWRALSRLLAREGPLKVFHNLMYDFLVLAAYGIYVAPPYYDTMLAHNRSYLDFSRDDASDLQLNRLAFCTAIYTREPFYKDDHKAENRLEDWRGPDHLFWVYNAKDAVVLHEVMEATRRDLEALDNLRLFELDMKVFSALAYMGLLGVRRDTELLKQLAAEASEAIGSLQLEVNKEVGYDLNTKSSKQMQKLLYFDLNLPVQYNKKTGRPSADEAALIRLYQKTKLPLLGNIKKLNRLRTFSQNYLGQSVGLDGRSRTVYNQAKTSTCRVSSSTPFIGEGSNLQVVPSYEKPGEEVYNRIIRTYKDTFLADEGCVLWRLDYEQAEARVVAWLSQDLQQIHDFQNGVDVHLRTVEILLDMPYDEVLDRYLNGDPFIKMWRGIGKKVRHASNYKMGPRELQIQLAKAEIDMELRDCKRTLEALVTGLPALVRWHEEVEESVRSTRTVVNCFGRRRIFYGPITDNVIREAIAYGPQSTVADMLNFSLVGICESGLLEDGADLLLQLHDAVIGQSPVDKVQDHVRKVAEIMSIPIQVHKRTLVIPTDVAVGPSWGKLKKPNW